MRKITTTCILLLGLISAGYTQTVTIGDQVWSTKNLDVATFRNGDLIPEAKTKKEWKEAAKKKQPAWCYYDNDPANGEKYGKLYNWYAVSDSRGLAPEGWHVPSMSEWMELYDYLKGLGGQDSKSTSGWIKNQNGTNESGFSGQPGGIRFSKGSFQSIGIYGYWWSTTEDADAKNFAWYRRLFYNSDGTILGNIHSKEKGLSVRCLRD